MKDKPLFSVIMPNHNNGKYIKESIESVLAQTYPHWELVIVDDASTDNSVDVIRTYLGDGRIKLIRNDVNKGVAHAAKKAVEASHGEIVGTLDSDDVLLEEALMVMSNEHKANPEYGLIYSNHYICDENAKILGEAAWLGPWPDHMCMQEVLLGIQDKITISTAFRTFKRSAYDRTEGYDETLLCYEDRDLYYKLEKVSSIKGINRCLYCYRDNSKTGAYRRNSKKEYYWFVCAYKEVNRRLRLNMPCVDRKNISPFLANLMYIHLRKSSNVSKARLRKLLNNFLLGTGYSNLNNNKLLALLYILNSYIYGFTPITLKGIKSFFIPELSEK